MAHIWQVLGAAPIPQLFKEGERLQWLERMRSEKASGRKALARTLKGGDDGMR